MLTKGKLAVLLSRLKGFNQPKPLMEQYIIPSEVAATVLWNMLLFGDIEGKSIADLGAGTGILGLGAAILGARKVHLIEIDKDALAIARENALFLQEEAGVPLPITFEECHIENFTTQVDVVIQNPPFGVQKKHADRLFLEKAFSIANVVYSFHKEESGQFLTTFASEHNFVITHHWASSWSLPATMAHHTKRKHPINVGTWRFVELNYLK